MAAPVRVRIEVFGVPVLDRLLLRWEANATDLTVPFGEVVETWAGWSKDQFRTRGRAMGTPWVPLKAETIAAKRHAGAKTPTVPLVFQGGLKRGMTGGLRTRADGAVREVGPSEAAFGTRDPVAMYHQGKERSEDNPVPRRVLFELDESKRRATLRIIHRGIFDT